MYVAEVLRRTAAAETDSYCRLCASRTTLRHLRSFAEPSLFATVRRLCAGIRRTDRLPQAACVDCVRLLEKLGAFLRRVAAAQLTLADIFPRKFHSRIRTDEVQEKDILLDKTVNNNYSSDKDDDPTLSTLGYFKYKVDMKKEGSVISEEEFSADSLGPRWSDYWRCRRCDHRATSLQRLREHSWREHARCVVFKCTLCSVRMFTYKHFLQHMPRHLAGLRSCCEHCDVRFPSAAALLRHRELQHTTESTSHHCANCGSPFATPAALRAHRNSFTVVRASTAGGRLFCCEHCPKTFANKIGLLGHMDCHNPGKNTCKICNKIYKNKYNLKRHQSYVHDPKLQFVCQICGKGFKLANHLKAHLNIHNDVRPWSCKKCDKTFRTKFQLEDHKVCHTDIRPHACKDCNKSYKFMSSLRIHLKSHLKSS